MAHRLLEKEVLSLEDIEAVFGPRPFTMREGANIDRYRGIRREIQDEEGGAEADTAGADTNRDGPAEEPSADRGEVPPVSPSL